MWPTKQECVVALQVIVLGAVGGGKEDTYVSGDPM